MISKTDRKVIVELARKYNVKELFLFGSNCNSKRVGNDIDLAVKGIKADKFFSFYGDLMLSLSRPVDLVDLSKNNKFNRLINQTALRLYGGNS
jgi:predicted nucleotidyltransferase